MMMLMLMLAMNGGGLCVRLSNGWVSVAVRLPRRKWRHLIAY